MVAYLKNPEGSEGFHQIVDFLNASHIRTLDNREIELTAIIDGKVKNVTEASIRRYLQLADAYSISSLPTTKIFKQLSLMGQESVVPQPRSHTQTPVADEAASTGMDVRYGGDTTTVTGLEAGQGSGNIDKTPTMPHDSPLPRKVESLETNLKQTKQIYGAAYTKFIKRVKKLAKTGRKIAAIDQDPGISLVQHDAKIQGRYGHDMEFNLDVSTAGPVSTAGAAVTTASVAVSTASPIRNTRVSIADDITMAKTLVYIRKSAAKDKVGSRGGFREYEEDEIRDGSRLIFLWTGEYDRGWFSQDNTIVVPVDEPIFLPEGTEPAEVERLLVMTTHSPSPPILLYHHPLQEALASAKPHLHISSTITMPITITSSIWVSTQFLDTQGRGFPVSEQPPRKRLCLSTLGSRYKVGESSTARPTRGRGIDYGFVSTVDAEERR
ncbi:hypothetical protein Tco_1244713 [Tanacetum coccineum]